MLNKKNYKIKQAVENQRNLVLLIHLHFCYHAMLIIVTTRVNIYIKDMILTLNFRIVNFAFGQPHLIWYSGLSCIY